MSTSRTIVFIHGLFLNPLSWQQWKKYFENNGFTCYTPAYPFHEGDPAFLRKNIDQGLGKLDFDLVLNSMQTFVKGLPQKPILIGHSMGGLLVQKLVAMNLASAGICIDSAPPKGIVSFQWSFIKANFPVLNPFKGDSVFIPSTDWFHYAFCHLMTAAEAKEEYEQFVVPESRNIPRSSIGKTGMINCKKPHGPILFIAGAADHIIPASLNKKNFEAYTDKGSKTTFKEFSGRTHYLCAQENWQEIADFVLHWIDEI